MPPTEFWCSQAFKAWCAWLCRYLVRDHAGRLVLPLDSVESRRGEAWKSYVVVACVGAPSLRDKVERAGARRVSTGREQYQGGA